MADDMSGFVRRLRRRLHMTQEEFAHALGITVGTVNRWENARFRPSKLARATLVDFAHQHGVAVQDHETSCGEPAPALEGDKSIQ